MKLEEFRVYQESMELGEKVWNITIEWDKFAKNTMGYQLVRAVDSIAANLSEGYGRYHYKEAKNFSYYSRGSLFETKTWLTKANNRCIIDKNTYKELITSIDSIGIKLNNYINSIGKS